MAGAFFFKLPCSSRPESFWKREVFMRQSHGWCFLFQVCLATGPAHGWCSGFYLLTCNILNFKTLNPKQKTVDNLLGVTNIVTCPNSVRVTRFGPRTVTFFCPSHGVDTLRHKCFHAHPIGWTLLRNFVHLRGVGNVTARCPHRLDNVTSSCPPSRMDGESSVEMVGEKQNHSMKVANANLSNSLQKNEF